MNKKFQEVEYFYTIDLLRGFAAIGILVWHYQHFYFFSGDIPMYESKNVFPFYSVFTHIYENGSWLVQFFWTLSGFVFSFVYFDKIVKAKVFFISRFARLYPLHIITFFFILILQQISIHALGYYQINTTNDMYHGLLHMFFISGWIEPIPWSFNSPVWSISVEIIVYTLFFLTLKALRNRPFLLSSFMITFSFIILSLFLALNMNVHWTVLPRFLLFNENISALHSLFMSGQIGPIFIIGCVFYFYFGVTAYVLSVYLKKSLILLLCSALMFIACSVFINFYFDGIFSGTPPLDKFYNLILSIIKMALLFSGILLVVAWFDLKGFSKRFKDVFLWIGNNTYSTYLWHLPIQVGLLIVLDYLSSSRNFFNSEFTFLVWITSMMLIGRVSFLYLERPLKNAIKRKFI